MTIFLFFGFNAGNSVELEKKEDTDGFFIGGALTSNGDLVHMRTSDLNFEKKMKIIILSFKILKKKNPHIANDVSYKIKFSNTLYSKLHKNDKSADLSTPSDPYYLLASSNMDRRN
jgi:hypothetical protein